MGGKIFGWLVTLFGLWMLADQIYMYLKEGYWLEMPATDIWLASSAGYWHFFGKGTQWYELKGPFALWLNNPQSWLGLHKIVWSVLHTLSLPFLVIVFGMVFVLTSNWSD